MYNRSVVLQTMLSVLQLDIKPDLDSPISNIAATEAPVCYGAYGCFPVDGPWSGRERPVSLVPQPPHELELHICLHTKQQPHCHVLDVENFSSIQKSTLNSSSNLYVIAHGFVDSRNIAWISEMTNVLLDSQPKSGVITIGWGKAAHPPYTQAVANCRIVGHVVGYLLHILVEYFDHKASLVHLIGHSLGSHLMGYAGSYFKQIRGEQVSRITGLDPAGPYFINTPPEVRLDPTDAVFVEVIHTDETSLIPGLPVSLGLPAAIGHVDYYPNGGNSQIGCEGSMASKVDFQGSFGEGVISYIGCHHQRAIAYFIDAVNGSCKYEGVACASWEDYLHGRCWGPCEIIDTCYTFVQSNPSQILTTTKQEPPINMKVFFGTNPQPSFCAEQYLVTVMSTSSVASMESGGAWARLSINLFGTLNNVVIKPPEDPEWLSAGGVARWVGFGRPLGELRHARVTYHEDPGFLGMFIPRLNHDTLFLEKIFFEELSTGRRIDLILCSQEIKVGELQVLFHNRTC